MKKPLALFLVAAFGVGLLAGPHPCKAQHGGPAVRHASCSAHQSAHQKGAPTQEPSSKRDCCDTFCRHSCQATAIATAEPSAIVLGPVAQAVAEVPGRGLPPIAHTIDHIPLA